jgi:hypothetical protein
VRVVRTDEESKELVQRSPIRFATGVVVEADEYSAWALPVEAIVRAATDAHSIGAGCGFDEAAPHALVDRLGAGLGGHQRP